MEIFYLPGRLLPYKSDFCHRADDWSYGPIKLRKLYLPACNKFYNKIYVSIETFNIIDIK